MARTSCESESRFTPAPSEGVTEAPAEEEEDLALEEKAL
jgi:hypothetical protein